jgi:hypothetical protein
MRINSVLTLAFLGNVYAAISADEVTTCLNSVTDQLSEADTKAQDIAVATFPDNQSVSSYHALSIDRYLT